MCYWWAVTANKRPSASRDGKGGCGVPVAAAMTMGYGCALYGLHVIDPCDVSSIGGGSERGNSRFSLHILGQRGRLQDRQALLPQPPKHVTG
jgi:hypothetical protein